MPEKWYFAEKVAKKLNDTQNLLSRRITLPETKPGVSCVYMEIRAFGKGFFLIEVKYPDKIFRHSIAFELFCRKNGLDISFFDDCLYR